MKDEFEDFFFREITNSNPRHTGNLIKAKEATVVGRVKIDVEEDSHDGVRVILKKDKNDTIKEIRFVCSCGQTKSILVDYSA
ncbi:MAG: hypothetical protein WCJ01_06585 [Ignavibacteria bacterium]